MDRAMPTASSRDDADNLRVLDTQQSTKRLTDYFEENAQFFAAHPMP
jgi:hypothetical protein